SLSPTYSLSLHDALPIFSLLLPAKVLNAAYAAPLRRFAESKLTIVAVDDWSADARRHFDADTFPLGLTVANTPPSSPPNLTLGRSEEHTSELQSRVDLVC